jgi:molecular chaperone DnaK
MSGGRTIGIDLGTTNSVVAAVGPDGEPQVLQNEIGERFTPSVVAFENDEAIVGRAAANQSAQNPEYTVHSIKREMGREEFEVEAPWDEAYTPEEISALILAKLVEDAEMELDEPVTNAVITVPAYFGNRQREATKYAGEIAGLEVDRLLNEPTAACFAYGLQEQEDGLIFVYDLGGGTFDASLVDTNDGVFEVRATNGHTQLGGEDWDARILDRLLEEIQADVDVDIEEDVAAMERLWDAAQAAKHELAAAESTTVSVPFLLTDPEYNLEVDIAREEFQQLTGGLLEETFVICDELFEDVDVGVEDVDEVLLAGGSTRMPQVERNVERYFGMEPTKRINPDEAVAVGAAAQAALLDTETSDSGDDQQGEATTADAATPTGHEGDADATESATAPSTTADATPSEPADDAQAASIAEDGDLPARLEDVVLLDVTPKTLGVESRIDGEAGRFSPLIARNTSVPAAAEQTYHTYEDDQTQVRISVYQGEHEHVEHNELLDEFTLSGLPAAPAGEEAVTVTFQLDEDGILNVSAVNPTSGTEASITIESAFGHSEADIEDMRTGLPEIK